MSRRQIVGLASVSVALLALTLLLDLTEHPAMEPHEVWTSLLFASAWMLGGLVAWARRPDNRCGLLMTLTGWGWLLEYLSWDEPVSFTFSRLLGGVGIGFLVHLMVVFPEGWLRSRFERVVVAVNYVGWIIVPVFGAFWDPTLGCSDCPRNLLLIRDDPRLNAAVGLCGMALIVFVGVSVAVLLVRRWLRATRPGRRVLAPVVGMATVALVLWVAWLVPAIWLRPSPHSAVYLSLAIATSLAGAAVPLAFLAGLLRARLHRGAVAELLVELDRVPALAQPREAIARALGDPGLRLGYWLPGPGRYVDFDGQPMPLPAAGTGRAVTRLESGGQPLAVLVYDPSLLEDRTMLDAVGSAARLALENARLHAALRAQLAEVRASRARIVAAGDAERRTIERNLHDGAQQHLLGIRLALRLARTRLNDTVALSALIDEADTEVAAAVDELRRLARGIHPALLTEAGLEPALGDLARRSPVPVTVTALDERLPAPVEAAVYYVVAEALANVTKHAHARTATVDVQRLDGRLVLEVADDGIGGADPRYGTGLRNLQDRVEALAGTLTVTSDHKCGTRIQAVIPCA
jgi:signal transduction histidine kinase